MKWTGRSFFLRLLYAASKMWVLPEPLAPNIATCEAYPVLKSKADSTASALLVMVQILENPFKGWLNITAESLLPSSKKSSEIEPWDSFRFREISNSIDSDNQPSWGVPIVKKIQTFCQRQEWRFFEFTDVYLLRFTSIFFDFQKLTNIFIFYFSTQLSTI